MPTTIRAKFRCMSVTRTWDDKTQIELLPVNRSSAKDPENAKFWDATPSGKGTLHFKGSAPEWKPGAYYYIDMEPGEGGWKLESVTHHSEGQGDIHFHRSWDPDAKLNTGQIEFWVKYPKTLALFGEPGIEWTLTFTFAEANDGALPPC